jgi:hypothetical protein
MFDAVSCCYAGRSITKVAGLLSSWRLHSVQSTQPRFGFRLHIVFAFRSSKRTLPEIVLAKQDAFAISLVKTKLDTRSGLHVIAFSTSYSQALVVV